MDTVVTAGDASNPKDFAKNTAEIAVPPSNPGKVTSVSDLAKSSVKVALCQPKVPCGVVAAEVFKNAGLTLLADRIRLDLDGLPPALVEVTPTAVAELSLDPGSQVWLTVKATDLEVYPHNGAQAG